MLDANANAPALLVMQQNKRLGSSYTAQDQHALNASDCVLQAIARVSYLLECNILQSRTSRAI
jgi:hypothetical protein